MRLLDLEWNALPTHVQGQGLHVVLDGEGVAVLVGVEQCSLLDLLDHLEFHWIAGAARLVDVGAVDVGAPFDGKREPRVAAQAELPGDRLIDLEGQRQADRIAGAQQPAAVEIQFLVLDVVSSLLLGQGRVGRNRPLVLAGAETQVDHDVGCDEPADILAHDEVDDQLVERRWQQGHLSLVRSHLEFQAHDHRVEGCRRRLLTADAVQSGRFVVQQA